MFITSTGSKLGHIHSLKSKKNRYELTNKIFKYRKIAGMYSLSSSESIPSIHDAFLKFWSNIINTSFWHWYNVQFLYCEIIFLKNRDILFNIYVLYLVDNCSLETGWRIFIFIFSLIVYICMTSYYFNALNIKVGFSHWLSISIASKDIIFH